MCDLVNDPSEISRKRMYGDNFGMFPIVGFPQTPKITTGSVTFPKPRVEDVQYGQWGGDPNAVLKQIDGLREQIKNLRAVTTATKK